MNLLNKLKWSKSPCMKQEESFANKQVVTVSKDERGFSLIELLVVVGIIGVLAAVAIPAYNKYQTDAAANTAKISAKSIYKAIAVCSASGETGCASGDVKDTLDQSCVTSVLSANGCQITGVNDSNYCVATRVKDKGFCIDSTGTSKDGITGCDDGSNAAKSTCL